MTDSRALAPEVSDDAILNGRLRLFQPKRGHRFGHDAILLAAAVPAQPGQRVAEFGAGVGAASLALLARVPDIGVTLLEIDPALVALAQENIARNGFAGRARAVTCDVTAIQDEPEIRREAGFDHVFMNPPFNDPRLQASPEPARRGAHAAPPDLLGRWIASARGVLRPGGTVTVIWRASGLADVVRALEDGFGAISIRPVYPAPGRAAIRLLANARKAGGAPLCILPPLTLNDDALRPTSEAEEILRHGAALPVTEA